MEEMILDAGLNNDIVVDTKEGKELAPASIEEEEVNYFSTANNNIVFDLYPNPTNDFVTIDLENVADSKITISIYNTVGQEVSTVFEGYSESNTLSTRWADQKGNLVTGTYFVVIKQNDEVKLAKPLRYNQ